MTSGFTLEFCIVVKAVTGQDKNGPLMEAQNSGRYAQVSKAIADAVIQQERP